MANTPLYIPVLEERKRFVDYRNQIGSGAFNWYGARTWEQIKYVVIHHSVTNPTNNTKSDIDYIHQIHKNRGWGSIGYHFCIGKDGMVYYVGDISTMRANVANKNHLVIGVCLVGDFTKSNPTDEQILSAHDLCKFLLFDMSSIPNLKDWGQLTGHKELQATQCPGTNWKGVGDSIYERIKNRIPYTPQSEPEPVIDWKKRYYELEQSKNKEIGVLRGEKVTLNEELSEIGVVLADETKDCQTKIEELDGFVKLPEKENNEEVFLPPLTDYDKKQVLARATEIVVEWFRTLLKRTNDKK